MASEQSRELVCDRQNGVGVIAVHRDGSLRVTAIAESRKLVRESPPTAFVDFHKAYDGIHRTLLWNKLSDFDICGHILNTLRSLL